MAPDSSYSKYDLRRAEFTPVVGQPLDLFRELFLTNVFFILGGGAYVL